jgi:hypothetical protein
MSPYRGPAELEPRATADGQYNRVSLGRLGAVPANMGPIEPIYGGPRFLGPPMPRMCPAWGCGGPPWQHFIAPGIPGTTSIVDQPPPLPPGSAPIVSGVCGPGQYRDAAGNCTTDWHNPYSLYLPNPPAPTVAAPTPLSLAQPGTTLDSTGASTTVATGSWFTDPTQELISGVPNWGLVAAAGALFLMMRGRR